MNFGDKQTHTYWVKEGTVHPALLLNGTGATESPLMPRLELTRFPRWKEMNMWSLVTLLVDWKKDGAEREELKKKTNISDRWEGLTVAVELMFAWDLIFF